MGLKIHMFIAQCILLCNQCVFIYGQNSRNAREGEFPFVVSISKINDRNAVEKNHVCAGVLISNKDVLTLEFCSRFAEADPIVILVGNINLNSALKHYPLWWLTYKQWADIELVEMKFQQNEVTIIRLTETVPPSIQPAVCRSIQNVPMYGATVTIAGWGEITVGRTPSIMQTAVLHVISNVLCEHKLSTLFSLFEIHDNYLCSNGDYREENLQLIDFGGPLLYNGELIGINQESYPLPFDAPYSEKINMHVRLDYYSDFMLSVINDF